MALGPDLPQEAVHGTIPGQRLRLQGWDSAMRQVFRISTRNMAVHSQGAGTERPSDLVLPRRCRMLSDPAPSASWVAAA